MKVIKLAITLLSRLQAAINNDNGDGGKLSSFAPTITPAPTTATNPTALPYSTTVDGSSDISSRNPTVYTSPPTVLTHPRRNDDSNKLDILDFTPHLDDDEPHSVLPDHIVHERVNLVANYTNGIRTFACYNGAEAIRYAHSIGLYTVAGAWVDTRTDKATEEMDCIINLAREGVVDLASIGSEVLTWSGLSAEEIVEYIAWFRQMVPNVMVTTAVKYEAMMDVKNQEIIIPAVDVLYINYYPYWSGYHISLALAVHKAEHAEMKAIAGDKEVWISETGWPSEGSCWNGYAEPSPDNQERFLREVFNWTRSENVVLTWFDGFEQPWKNGNEWCNVAAHWGIFDRHGVIKAGPARVLEVE